MKLHLIGTAIAAAVVLASPGWGDAPKPFPDFTFKRVKPPKAGASKRITVQIAPAPPRPAAAAAPKPTPSAPDVPPAAVALAPAGDAQDWFWTAVSGRSPAGRVDSALSALRKGPSGQGFPSPRLQTLRQIADAYGRDILKFSVGTRISPALALAVIAVESGGRSDAVSRAGAQGLMQLMPATAARFGVVDATRATENIRGGITYLDWLMGEFGGDALLALAGYNAGEGAVRKHGGVPPYAETRAYVPKVLAAWSVARGLCLSPPELITDGCVFVGGRAATNG
ncbi:lytic transglycosylase domain-containing protein [Oceaniglobus roseus]|uniref:lytic transglycosylase domain-containing protein n=1 Tax=Oceaniglobus roseus TaxID=1737570 RepID=UPI000C7F2908|nr:lytic transglycosylase domain-containing protein [Kandeliimicrobium roseum]